MRSIGVRELRQNAGLYLRDVQHGETIEITHHGHPIAQLIPATNDAWGALIASKEVIAARTHPRDILAHPPRAYGVNGSAALAGMRRGER